MITNRQRNIDLAKIHLAKKQLGLDDETYRAMLWTVARVNSAADLDQYGRSKVLQHLKSRGFKLTRGRVKGPRAGLVYHIWNRMCLAGVVHQRGLGGWLQANTKRFNGIGFLAPEFCSSQALNQVIEQLKQWADREGVSWK